MTIGDRIKKCRLSLDMTLEDVAKIVGITRQTVQKYESGVVSNIPSDKIELLAKCFSTTPAYLMGWAATAQLEEAQQEVSDLKAELKLVTDPHEKQRILQDIETLDESVQDLLFLKNVEEMPRPTPVSGSGPISRERQALLDSVKDMDDETARVLLEMIKSIKRLRDK